MVHAIDFYNHGLKVIMDDKVVGMGEEKPVIDLPSLGLGKLLTNPEDAKKLMNRIRLSEGMLIMPNEVKKETKSKTLSRNDMTSSRGGGNKSFTKPHQMKPYEPKPGSSRDLGPQNKYGKTTPFTSINMEQLGELSDDYETKSDIFDDIKKLPKLSVTAAEYTRFRYASERPEKGKKKRQYEMDEDKRFLADVKVKNHAGPATVIMHCVTSDGRLHPYYLDGEDCEDGVYYKRFEFTPRLTTLKITKTTVIQPKAKEYKNSLRDQKRFLALNKALSGNEKTCDTPQDKQCVHLHVKVLLDEGRGQSYHQTITSAIRNKKDGTEFRIHAITPPSAMATGSIDVKLGTKVYIIVTQETAFPKNVHVVFRKKDINWEVVLKDNDINIIKKSVIELTPPAYVDPETTEDVEVEVCLRDSSTGKETQPAIFHYIRDEHGIRGRRAKKRKREDVEDMFSSLSDPLNIKAQERVVETLITGQPGTTETFGGSDSSDDTTPQSSLVYIQDNNTIIINDSEFGNGLQKDVSLETNRGSKVLKPQFGAVMTNASSSVLDDLSHGELVTTMQQSVPVVPRMDVVTSTSSMQTSQPSPLSVGLSNNYLQTSQQPTQLAEEDPKSNDFNINVIRQLSEDMLLRLSVMIKDKAVNLVPEAEKLVWERIQSLYNIDNQEASTSQSPQQVEVESEQVDPTSTAEQDPGQGQIPENVPQISLTDLPDLPPGYQYALIKGQILVVNNDLQDTSMDDQQVNISGQDVIIQSINPQQPIQSIDLQQSLLSYNLKSEDFRKLLQGLPSLELGSMPSGEPSAEFLRTTTSARSNLDGDDDLEMDSSRNQGQATEAESAEGSKKSGGDEMEVDEQDSDQSKKSHVMKLRGKKSNYKDMLKQYDEALDDIKQSEGDSNEENGNNFGKYNRFGKGKGKKYMFYGRGKSMYEDEDYAEKDVGTSDNGIDLKKGNPRKYSKGVKDMKLMKKMTDENSQGFACDSD